VAEDEEQTAGEGSALPRPLPFEPQDEWERGLLEAAIDCGVSLPDSAFSREELYD